MKPDPQDRASGDLPREDVEGDPGKVEQVDDALREMMLDAEALPLPDHLLTLLDELEEDETKPPRSQSLRP